MKVRFVAAAKAGLDAILRYYEKQPPGLGADFLDEVTSAVNQIAEFPDAWQLLEPEIRRYRINRFPYGIVYTQRGNHTRCARRRTFAPKTEALAREQVSAKD